MLTCTHGHYEIWEQWSTNSSDDRGRLGFVIPRDEYEEWPPGAGSCTLQHRTAS